MFFQRMSLQAAGNFCRRFGTGIRAGADVVTLLNSESKHGSGRQRDAMRELAERASQGEQLSEAMESRRGFFPRLLVSMTRVGELTGRLERTLLVLAEHFEHQLQLRRAFLTSIAWPALQFTMGIGVISLLIWLMGILTPATGGQMVDILGFGLRGASGVLIFWMYLAVFFGLLLGFVWAFSRNVAGLQNLIPLFYKIPVIGPAIQTITLARFSWTLSLALDAGLDPIRSISLALDSTDSDYYRSGDDDAERAIRAGATLAGGLRATEIFPDDYLTRIEISELSGTDAESIEGLANEYDERAKMAMKTIAGVASASIWISVLVFMVFMILRLLMNVSSMYGEALKGL